MLYGEAICTLYAICSVVQARLFLLCVSTTLWLPLIELFVINTHN